MATERPPANEFIRGPKWRTRTSARRRHGVATVTVAAVAVAGGALMWGCIVVLRWLGAPSWVALMPWLLPTAGAVVWTLAAGRAAEVTDDDDDSWIGYSLRWALVGELQPRPVPARVLAALVLGAPIVWAVMLSGVLTLIGLF
jgi:hypothetical protein